MNKKLSGLTLIFLFCLAVPACAGSDLPINIDDQAGLAAAIVHPAPQYSRMAVQLKLRGRVGLGV